MSEWEAIRVTVEKYHNWPWNFRKTNCSRVLSLFLLCCLCCWAWLRSHSDLNSQHPYIFYFSGGDEEKKTFYSILNNILMMIEHLKWLISLLCRLRKTEIILQENFFWWNFIVSVKCLSQCFLCILTMFRIENSLLMVVKFQGIQAKMDIFFIFVT